VASTSEIKRMRDAAMARVDPDEGARIAAAAAALEDLAHPSGNSSN
jgi:hypothetical protein